MPRLFDEYSLKARLIPAFLVLLPLVLSAWPWIENIQFNWKLAGEIIVYCGGTLFLAHLGRDLGREKEPHLFKLWDGKPTTRMLRHRDSSLDSITLLRYHTKLQSLLGIPLPSKTEEMRDPAKADELYESGIKILLEKTRDNPLVLKENINYGFRRNLWGMKPSATVICLISLAISGIYVANSTIAIGELPIAAIIATVADVVLLVWWLLRINPDWIHVTAEAYSLRLLAASERL